MACFSGICHWLDERVRLVIYYSFCMRILRPGLRQSGQFLS